MKLRPACTTRARKVADWFINAEPATLCSRRCVEKLKVLNNRYLVWFEEERFRLLDARAMEYEARQIGKLLAADDLEGALRCCARMRRRLEGYGALAGLRLLLMGITT
jgi:hypothetical protein